MKVKEIKILQDGKVEIVFESSFPELEEITLYNVGNVIESLEWNMNQARKDLKRTLKLLDSYKERK